MGSLFSRGADILNRHERRRYEALLPKDYIEEIKRVFAFVHSWLSSTGLTPTFAFPPDDLGIAGSLDHWGHHFARDEPAHKLVDALCEMTTRCKTEPPTINMLQLALKEYKVPTLTASLEELGIDSSNFVQKGAPPKLG